MDPKTTASVDEFVEFKRRIIEAEFLVIYAVQNGIRETKDETGYVKRITDEDFENVTVAKNTYGTAEWSIDKEVKFLNSLRNIADAVKPVSIQSIKTIHDNKYFSVTNLFSVVVRAFGNVGIFIINVFKKRDNHFKYFRLTLPKSTFAQQLTRNFSYHTVIIIAILLLAQTKYIIGTGLYNEFKMESRYCDSLSVLIKDISYGEENDSLSKMSSILAENHYQHSLKRERVGTFLDHWNDPWKIIFPSLYIGTAQEGSSLAVNSKLNHDYLFGATRYVLIVLYSYILPILYGLLGSACLILRNLFSEIRNQTLTFDQDIRFYLRLILGALSGLAIGWFFGVEEMENILKLKALSPMALAFIGGYSVDLLFSLLDSLIKKFTGSKAYATGN